MVATEPAARKRRSPADVAASCAKRARLAAQCARVPPRVLSALRHQQRHRHQQQPQAGAVLTEPSEGEANDGKDNANHDYICRVGDVIRSGASEEGYEILGSLGRGAFGQALRCRRPTSTGGGLVALKIVKHRSFCAEYALEAAAEARVLEKLKGHPHIVHLVEAFECHGHFCLAMELLGPSLLDVLLRHGTPGLPAGFVQAAGRQLLSALARLREASLVHGDLKPENVLLVEDSLDVPCATILRGRVVLKVKLIDFGTAQSCRDGAVRDEIIQTPPYRAPEVFFGLPFACSADMWSFGCVCAELFVGNSLLPHGSTEQGIIGRIEALVGPLPTHMLQAGPNTGDFFRKLRPPRRAAAAAWADSWRWPPVWSLIRRMLLPPKDAAAGSGASAERFELLRAEAEVEGEEGVGRTLSQVIGLARYEILRSVVWTPRRLRQRELRRQHAQRKRFLSFLKLALRGDPDRRPSPQEAMDHPFFCG